MFADNNFTENFVAGVPMGIFQMCKTISTALSVGEFINYY